MNIVFKITDKTKIYIVCPSNNKTGGTELLHQLVYELNSQRKQAFITYYYEGSSDRKNPTPDEFKKYINGYKMLNEIEDFEDNVLILPEVCIGKHRMFNKLQKSVWWLSVDNFKVMIGKKSRYKNYGLKSFIKHLWLRDFNKYSDIKSIDRHLYQSYFAQNFLINLGIDKNKTSYLSDYINDIYLSQNQDNNVELKKNIVIYNPKKGKKFTDKLISSSNNVKFIPIENMKNSQVIELMRSAKVYIDFGNHPGKDRIPREAAMSGCCIVTGRDGSANFYNDVPIPDKYKFHCTESNIKEILETITGCINNYEMENLNFLQYRQFISNEKNQFKNDVLTIFKSL